MAEDSPRISVIYGEIAKWLAVCWQKISLEYKVVTGKLPRKCQLTEDMLGELFGGIEELPKGLAVCWQFLGSLSLKKGL